MTTDRFKASTVSFFSRMRTGISIAISLQLIFAPVAPALAQGSPVLIPGCEPNKPCSIGVGAAIGDSNPAPSGTVMLKKQADGTYAAVKPDDVKNWVFLPDRQELVEMTRKEYEQYMARLAVIRKTTGLSNDMLYASNTRYDVSLVGENCYRKVAGVETFGFCNGKDFQQAGIIQPVGLAGLDGGLEVATGIVSNPVLFTSFLTELATSQRMPNPEKMIDSRWAMLRDDPLNDGALRAFVYLNMVASLNNPKATPEEKRLVTSFENFVRMQRIIVAKDALRAFKLWEIADRNWQAKTQGTNMATMLAGSYNTPPDYANQIISSMTAVVGPAAGIAGVFAASAQFSSNISSAVAANAAASAGKLAAKTTTQVIESMSLFKTGVFGSMSTVAGAGAAAAPALLVLVQGFANVMTLANAEPNLRREIDDAFKPVSLKDLIKTDDGKRDAAMYWQLAMGDKQVTPNNPAMVALQKAANASYAMRYPNSLAKDGWASLNGAATDVAVAKDGTIWVIGTGEYQPNGGFNIFRRGARETKWTKMPGKAARIAADDTVWVTNLSGKLFRHDGKTWQAVDLPAGLIAIDVAVGGGRTWVLAGKAGSKEASAWVLVNGQWFETPSKGKRIAVDDKGVPWLLAKDGAIWTVINDRWVKMTGLGIDIDIKKAGEPVVVGTDSMIWAYDGQKKTWTSANVLGKSVAIGPDGTLIYADTDQALFAAK